MASKADQKVCVAYLHPSDVSARFHRSVVNLLVLDAYGAKLPDGRKVGGKGRVGQGGAIMDFASGAQITRTRNRVVREFLELEGIDWLWMVDADMTFAPTILEQLIDAAHPVDRPVVGGLCFAMMAEQSRKYWPTLFAWIPGTNKLRRLTSYPEDRLVPVAGTGAACLLVHRSVLERMGERYSRPWPWFAETPFYEVDADGERLLETGDSYSEDLTFCLRAQACGFPVFVHTGIACGHVKTFEVDESQFLAESAMLASRCYPALPTYAVVASRSRPEMLATLRAQLSGQVSETFVFDNGYPEAPDGAIPAHGWGLHRMWNEGLDRAEKAAGGGPFNVLVVNDDVEVPNELCASLEAGLRCGDENWVSYPNWKGLPLGAGDVAEADNPQMAGQTMSGFCFMVRGEASVRFDERFGWWYGDTDLERTVRAGGHRVVCVGGAEVRHLDPLRSTLEDPGRLAEAEADEARFAEKWGLDPDGLWLAQRRVRGLAS